MPYFSVLNSKLLKLSADVTARQPHACTRFAATCLKFKIKVIIITKTERCHWVFGNDLQLPPRLGNGVPDSTTAEMAARIPMVHLLGGVPRLTNPIFLTSNNLARMIARVKSPEPEP